MIFEIGMRVRLISIAEIVETKKRHPNMQVADWLEIGEVGRVISPEINGCFEVRFESCVVFVTSSMVEWVPLGIEKRANGANTMIHLHLDEAYWCENCQCIIDSAIRCPSCATESNIISMRQFMPLIRQRIVEISTPIDLFTNKVINLGEPFIRGILKHPDETDEEFKKRYELSKGNLK